METRDLGGRKHNSERRGGVGPADKLVMSGDYDADHLCTRPRPGNSAILLETGNCAIMTLSLTIPEMHCANYQGLGIGRLRNISGAMHLWDSQ